MVASLLKKMKSGIKDTPLKFLKDVGLKNMHSYTLIDVREVKLANGELEYLIFLRNPTGNFFLKDYEVWKGDWGPLSEKWNENPNVRE
jgi:Calpain family cysteine protease